MTDKRAELSEAGLKIMQRLDEIRKLDPPTHGGNVLAYVYDTGIAELDELAARAARAVQPVNGLDPTTFPSVAVLEREVLSFTKKVFHGDDDTVGTVTSGGTESCLLAVKTARDLWRARGGQGVPRLVAPITAHAAFHKAAEYFDLELVQVSVDPTTRLTSANAVIELLDEQTALVVLSAPNYPFGTVDPIGQVAAETAKRGIALHVDSCIGGLVLPWCREADGTDLAPWDFRVPGVTSLSADLHKYGYAPKGVSVLLQRDRDRHRAQYFATKRWPGYPVVSPTLMGSKSVGALAAAWAIIQRLGEEGFARLTAKITRATAELSRVLSEIPGMVVSAPPVGPVLAVQADLSVPAEQRVDPHHWTDRVKQAGWVLQHQPGIVQPDGSVLQHTSHLTITPITEDRLPELVPALIAAADEVRGIPAVTAEQAMSLLPEQMTAALAGFNPVTAGGHAAGGLQLDSSTAFAMLQAAGVGGGDGATPQVPDQMAPLIALIQALPAPLTERLLIELLARLTEES